MQVFYLGKLQQSFSLLPSVFNLEPEMKP